MLLTTSDVVERLAREVEAAGSLSQWCRDRDIARGNVHAVLNHKRHPFPKLLAVMGLRRAKAFEELRS